MRVSHWSSNRTEKVYQGHIYGVYAVMEVRLTDRGVALWSCGTGGGALVSGAISDNRNDM